MQSTPRQYATIAEYIAVYPAHVQEILEQIRRAIQEEAPAATEAIAYGIPTFKLRGKNLVHFGAYKSHIGFYPTPSALEAFAEELSLYAGAKGTAQFPLDKPMPFDLIRAIVEFRVAQVPEQATKTKK